MKNTGAFIALAVLVWILADNKTSAGSSQDSKTAGSLLGSAGVITVLPGQQYSPNTGLNDRYGNRVYN